MKKGGITGVAEVVVEFNPYGESGSQQVLGKMDTIWVFREERNELPFMEKKKGQRSVK